MLLYTILFLQKRTYIQGTKVPGFTFSEDKINETNNQLFVSLVSRFLNSNVLALILTISCSLK